ncbi:MAG TPA: HAD family phosphatase [Paludibacteraceae bacterium]|nr:HAD family phosphatase [Paludibacteraceae bacterium]HPT42343.1 HAD family phosphatase [Paludibacteraceae bacterium]
MSKYKNVTTIIFDLGGVIIDLDWNLCIHNFENLGIFNMKNLVSTTLQKGFVLDYEMGMITDAQFRDEIRKNASGEVADHQIDHAWTSLLVGIPEEKLNLLSELKKKYKILMLSNTNNLSFRYSEKMFEVNGKNINDFFDKCYLSYKMKLAKPKPEIFEALLEDAGVKAEECLFLDDGIHNIETASELGMQTWLVEPYTSLSLNDF